MFRALDPVKAKGYTDPVQVYEPIPEKCKSESMISSNRKDAFFHGDSLFLDTDGNDYGTTNAHHVMKNVPERLMVRISGLIIFEKLILRVAAVIAIDIGKSVFSDMYATAHSQEKETFSLGVLTYVVTTLGHGHDVHKLQKGLESLCTSIPLLSSQYIF